jgi:hypothetical protein
MDQLVQIVGALLILVAFAAAQFGAMDPHSRTYLVLNFVGSLVLAVLAWRERQGVPAARVRLGGCLAVGSDPAASRSPAVGKRLRTPFKNDHGPDEAE